MQHDGNASCNMMPSARHVRWSAGSKRQQPRLWPFCDCVYCQSPSRRSDHSMAFLRPSPMRAPCLKPADQARHRREAATLLRPAQRAAAHRRSGAKRRAAAGAQQPRSPAPHPCSPSPGWFCAWRSRSVHGPEGCRRGWATRHSHVASFHRHRGSALGRHTHQC